MPKMVDFFSELTGSLQEKDNDYALVIGDDGKAWVEYRWSRTDPYKAGKSTDGREIISIADYLGQNRKGSDKLRELIAEHKINV